MGLRFFPGLKAAGIDPSTVDKLKEVARAPIEAAKERRKKSIGEKDELGKLNNLISELDTSLNSLKSRTDFYKLKLESSHPDILDGEVGPGALLGTYEFEVRSMARAEKELAYGFPDKDETSVGFGYLSIEKEDGDEIEIEVEPDTTLDQLAKQINESAQGYKAMVVNTKYQPDPYRLLVISEISGKEAKLSIDEDTTFLEFKEQVTGRNLDVLFEDVPVTDEDNSLNDLIEGVSLSVRRSEPGTRVQVSIVHDIDATLAGIKTFVEKYNNVSKFINSQFVENADTGKYGTLSGDSSLRHIMRELQGSIGGLPTGQDKYRTLADIGITTNSKTGTLEYNESKVRSALTENYDSVARIFIRSNQSTGVAEQMAQKLRNLRDPGFGTLKTRMRSAEKIIENQDKAIEQKERLLQQQEANIQRRFTSLENTLAGLKGQSDFLASKFGQQG